LRRAQSKRIGAKNTRPGLGKAAKSSDFLLFHRTAKPHFIALTRRHGEIILQRDFLGISHQRIDTPAAIKRAT
jgi:hypothetical protein